MVTIPEENISIQELINNDLDVINSQKANLTDLDKSNETEVNKMTKLEVGKSQSIPEGRHEGEITETINKVPNEKDEKGNIIKFAYTDYVIKLTDIEGEPTIKTGFPTDIKVDQAGKPTTGHAKFLKALGIDLSGEIDTEEVIGKKVSLMTQNAETERGTFARVVEGSIKGH